MTESNATDDELAYAACLLKDKMKEYRTVKAKELMAKDILILQYRINKLQNTTGLTPKQKNKYWSYGYLAGIITSIIVTIIANCIIN